MNVKERIEELRKQMEDCQVDAYYIPSADYHQSEYVSEHFKAREYISGFTGSAGDVVITKDKAGLWTDSRYFLQAEQELQGSDIKLYRMGEPVTATIEEFLLENLPSGGCLGFDGRTVSATKGMRFEQLLEEKQITLLYSKDLVEPIWIERPQLPSDPVFFLPEKYSGMSVADKLTKVRTIMQEKQANMHILTALDEICWLFNIRGRDVKYSPLVLSYAIVYLDKVALFIDSQKLAEEIKEELEKNKIEFFKYNSIYEAVTSIDPNNILLLDKSKVNFSLLQSIPKEIKVIDAPNPIILLKAIKNDIEIENSLRAHIKDGLAITKFMYWLKHTVGKERITELSAAAKLDTYRQEGKGYLWQSFAPICAYREHAAIVHYSASKESNSELQASHMLLLDTGGNYYEGSTDITRTIVLGEISAEERLHFTLVVISMLHMADAKFLHGISGFNLDILAKKPMWDRGLDYKHGTGHGVGHLLNVHEGPVGLRWQVDVSKNETNPLEAGMIVTDEPGLYIEGSHGVRIENELLVRKGEENIYGQFMYFEPMTIAPIDLDGLDMTLFSEEEKALLNAYHKKVYETLSPLLEKDIRQWLQTYTREV